MTTRRKPAAKPVLIEATDEIEVESDSPTPPPVVQIAPAPNFQGCMIPIMFAMMLAMFGFILWDRNQPAVAPTVPDAAPVVNLLDAFTAPIKTKLATDRAKAAIVADAYQGFSDALAGKSAIRIVDSKTLETVQAAFLADLDAKSGPAIGAEIDTAVGTYLGMKKVTDAEGTGWEPMPFDDAARAKLVEITKAISQAAGSVR